MSNFNEIGISRQLDRARIRKLLSIGFVRTFGRLLLCMKKASFPD